MLEERKYIGVDIFTGEWVSGDIVRGCNFNKSLWIKRVKIDKRGRKKVTDEWCVTNLHYAAGITPEGKTDYKPFPVDWFWS